MSQGKPVQKGGQGKSKSIPNTPMKRRSQGPRNKVHSRETRSPFSAITVGTGDMDGRNVLPRKTSTEGS